MAIGRSGWTRPASLAAAACAVLAAAASADPAPEAPPAPAAVPLDRLLRLPDSMAIGSGPAEERRGGKTRSEWQQRFASAEADLESARRALEDSRKKLEEIAPDKGWSMSAPGMPVSTSESPLDFKLRQEIRRNREEVDHATVRLDELGVEANLAGVPEEWRHPGAPAGTEAAAQPAPAD